jgi:hypothetical protein
MWQAGIKKITLYENKGITFRYWNPGDLNAITDLVSTGQVISIENIQRPEFEIKLKFGKSGKVLQDFKLEFLLFGLTLDNYDILNSLKTSIYGWCFLVEFYDGTIKYYNTPLYCRESEIKPHDEMSFKATMQTTVGTDKNYLDYTAGVPAVFRWDSEFLTWDSEIYSFDYEL